MREAGWRQAGAGRIGAVLLLLLLGGGRAAGHELGAVRTEATFRHDGTFRIQIVIDREHLPPGFASDVPAELGIRGLTREQARGPAGRILAQVARHVEARFDGRPSRLELEWVDPEPAATELTLALTGTIPGGASTFTWRNSLKVGSYLLTLRTEGTEPPQREWLEGGSTSPPFPLRREVVPPTAGRVVSEYLALGFTHILPKGTDHILFVLGVFLLSRRWRPVLLQVTAFTVAHTITLGLTIYGVVSLSPRIVEPLIALSIVAVAVENLFTTRLTRWRIALVFVFGLVHGMGFAGVLSGLGLPRSQFLPALISFNAGVELGQLTVILAAFLLVGLPFGSRPWYHRRVVVPLSIAIAAVGLAWAIQRTVGN